MAGDESGDAGVPATRSRDRRRQRETIPGRCNGTAPIPASSGTTVRYRLNAGGDRQANNAIHTIAITRAKHQPETRAYLERRIQKGKTKREALRSLNARISPELYHRFAALALTS
jgi:transposase